MLTSYHPTTVWMPQWLGPHFTHICIASYSVWLIGSAQWKLLNKFVNGWWVDEWINDWLNEVCHIWCLEEWNLVECLVSTLLTYLIYISWALLCASHCTRYRRKCIVKGKRGQCLMKLNVLIFLVKENILNKYKNDFK